MSDQNDTDYLNDNYTIFGPIEFLIANKQSEQSVGVKVVMIFVLSFFMIASVFGNVCTCAIIARNKTMRTPTNCYLFNLAVTDLLVSLFIPIEIYFLLVPDNYPWSEIGCRVHLLVGDTLTAASSLTISAFSIERYLVVTRPFLRQRLALNARVIKIITFIWALAIVLGIPDVLTIDLRETESFIYCYFTSSEILTTFVFVNIVLLFVMPLTIITVLYLTIALKLKKARRRKQSPIHGKQDREKAVKMLAAVAGLFFISWSPYCVFKIMVSSRKFKYEQYYKVWRVLYFVCSINVYLSTAGNPILYSLMSRKFRTAFKDLLNRKNLSRNHHSYNMSLTSSLNAANKKNSNSNI